MRLPSRSHSLLSLRRRKNPTIGSKSFNAKFEYKQGDSEHNKKVRENRENKRLVWHVLRWLKAHEGQPGVPSRDSLKATKFRLFSVTKGEAPIALRSGKTFVHTSKTPTTASAVVAKMKGKGVDVAYPLNPTLPVGFSLKSKRHVNSAGKTKVRYYVVPPAGMARKSSALALKANPRRRSLRFRR